MSPLIKIVFLCAILFLATGAYAAYPEITQVTYNPSPAVPGTTLTLFVQLENKDSITQKEVTITVDNNYPFTVKDETPKNIGDLLAYGKAQATFTIYVDPTAENKTYSLPITVSVSDNTSGLKTNYPITIGGKEPSIKVIAVSDDKLIPGQEKEITLQIQNVGTGPAYDLIVEMQEDRTVTAAGIVVEREITPLGAAATYLAQLNPGEKKEATLKLNVNSDATLKNYLLPVKITYRNASGTRTTDTSYVGFKVAGNVEIDAILGKSSTPFIAGTQKEISVELFNKGAGKAEFIIVELETNAGTIEQPKQFIGTLEPNDVDSFKTNITLDSNLSTGAQTLKVKISYQDSDATTKTVIIPLQMQVYSASEGAALSGGGSNIIIAIIVLIVIVIIAWRVKKRFFNKKGK